MPEVENADAPPASAGPGEATDATPPGDAADTRDDSDDRPRGPMIEGGREAVVIGATIDGFAAAILMAKAGVDVVLVENDLRLVPNEPRVPASGFAQDLEDAPLSNLDPHLVKDLGLSRRGLSFADRRLQTVYLLSDGAAYRSDGDLPGLADLELTASAEADAETTAAERQDAQEGGAPVEGEEAPRTGSALSAEDRRTCAAFMERLVDAAAAAEAIVAGDAPEKARSQPRAHASDDGARLLTASLEEYLASGGLHSVFRDVLAAEASLVSATRPDAPLSAGALALRLFGVSLGRRGALAFPKGGVRGLSAALRRSAQAAGVDIRPVGAIDRLLIERDRIEGVSFSDGGQIRAPVVVDASSARQAFLDHVGRRALDIDCGFRWERQSPSIGALRASVAFNPNDGDARRGGVDERPRYVVAPTLSETLAAHAAVAGGKEARQTVAEALFVNDRIAGSAPKGGAAITVRCAPFPRPGEEADEAWRSAAERAIKEALGRIDPSLPGRVAGMAYDWTPLADPAAIEAANARLASAGSGVIGHYFCGREAQLGVAMSGRAGRLAAARAIAFAKERRR